MQRRDPRESGDVSCSVCRESSGVSCCACSAREGRGEQVGLSCARLLVVACSERMRRRGGAGLGQKRRDGGAVGPKRGLSARGPRRRISYLL